MRINDELEKALTRLEENSSDYTIGLLDVARAFESAYEHINNSILKDITDFEQTNGNIVCKKVRYDSINGKTIYSVNLSGTDENVLNIEVSPLGDYSWVITSTDKEKAEDIIQEINRPNNTIMENLKMNADISFFSQNRELVLSDKPYIALKMGNFMEGDKAVIVYKEEGKQDEINKVNGGIKYIRVDQIEGYLKNIKIDERKIPVLAYAYLGRDYDQEVEYSKNMIERELHPEYTDEQIEKFKSDAYQNSVFETVLCVGVAGLLVGAIGGGIGAGILFSAGGLGAIIGGGLPVAAAALIYNKQNKKINFALNKEQKTSESIVALYRSIREYANENIVNYEQEFTRRRNKKQKPIFKLAANLSASEIVRELNKTLTNDDSTQAKFYNLALAQIINSYNVDPINNAEKIKSDSMFYGELIRFSDEVKEMNFVSNGEAASNSLAIIKRLIDCGDNNLVIQILSNYDRVLSKANIDSYEEKNKIENDLKKLYLEALVNGSYQEHGLSVETIAEIPVSTRNALLNRISTFGRRLQDFNDTEKIRVGNLIHSNIQSNDLSEIQIIKTIKYITNNNMEYDLLGKVPKQKVKEIK